MNNRKSNKAMANKPKTRTTGALASRGRPRKPAAVTTRVTPLPAMFPKFPDQFVLRLRHTTSFIGSTDTSALLYVYSPLPITTTSYTSIGYEYPMVAAMALQYSRYAISRASAVATPTMPATSGGYLAINYEPTNSGVAGPPGGISDVTTSVHSDVAQITESAGVEVKPTDYFTTWLPTTFTAGSGGTEAFTQSGVTQVYCRNGDASGKANFLLTIEVDIHFAGLRK